MQVTPHNMLKGTMGSTFPSSIINTHIFFFKIVLIQLAFVFCFEFNQLPDTFNYFGVSETLKDLGRNMEALPRCVAPTLKLGRLVQVILLSGVSSPLLLS
jgi:hypothetical protein